MKPSIARRRRGFTLVELLVAISILAILAVLGWRGLDGIVRARIALTEQMEVTRGMQLAFAQMQSDCENLAGRDVIGRRPNLQWEDGRFTLVRKVYNENEPSQLVVVSYRLAGGKLVRRESRGTRDLTQLEALWQAAASDVPSQSVASVTLQSGLTGMTIMAYQANAWRTEPVAGAAGSGAAAFTATPTATATDPNAAQPDDPTGLQVGLIVPGQAVPMVKFFLLGGT